MMHERLRNNRVGGLPISATWPSGAEAASKYTMSDDVQVHQTCPGTGMMAMVALDKCCPLFPVSRIMLPGLVMDITRHGTLGTGGNGWQKINRVSIPPAG
jgi:hypothetical protein